MKNPLKRKPKVSTTDTAAPPTPDQLIDMAKRRLAEANSRRASLLDNSTKWRKRTMVVITLGLIATVFLFSIALGYDIAKHSPVQVAGDIVTIVMSSVVLLFIFMDVFIDARMGRRLLQAHKEENAKEDKLVSTVKDVLGDVRHILKKGSDIKEAHFQMLATILEETTAEVIAGKHGGKENVPKAYQPTEDDAREIERRFKQKTNHNVQMKWDGNSWEVELDEGHDHATDEANETDTAIPGKGESQARREAKKASKKK